MNTLAPSMPSRMTTAMMNKASWVKPYVSVSSLPGCSGARTVKNYSTAASHFTRQMYSGECTRAEGLDKYQGDMVSSLAI